MRQEPADRGIALGPVPINAEMEALVARAIHRNFVPVVDDREVFLGIVRSQRILQ